MIAGSKSKLGKSSSGKKKTVVMIAPFLDNSSYLTVHSYANAACDKYSVKVVGMNRESVDADIFIQPARGSDIKVKNLSPIIGFSGPKVLTTSIGAVLTFLYLWTNEVDIIHCFKPRPHTLIPALFANLLKGTKLVVTADDYESGTNSKFGKLILGALEGLLVRADKITVSSSGLNSIYGGEVIYQRVTTEVPKYVLYAGSCYPFKGVLELINAVNDSVTKPKLVIAGTGPAKYMAELKKNAGPQTIFLGQVPKDIVPILIKECSIFAVPTLSTPYSERETPGKIFEAMRAGKPILTTRVSDIPKIVGNAAYVVEPGCVKSMAEAIDELMSNDLLTKDLSSRISARYLLRFSEKQLRKQVEDIYREL